MPITDASVTVTEINATSTGTVTAPADGSVYLLSTAQYSAWQADKTVALATEGDTTTAGYFLESATVTTGEDVAWTITADAAELTAGTKYYVVYQSDDQEYNAVSTLTAAEDAEATSYAMSTTTTATSGTQTTNTLNCFDQYGNAFGIADLAASAMTKDAGSDSGYNGTMTVAMSGGASDGTAVLTFSHTDGDTAATSTATKWTYALENGYSLVATWASGTGTTGAAETSSTWTITVDDGSN